MTAKILYTYPYLSPMKMYTSLFYMISLYASWSPNQVSLPLCGTDINLSISGFKNSPVLMYNMHDNENTAAISGRIMAVKYGGQYMELEHSGDRNITFLYETDTISIDPNRIYTNTGIWLQLAKNNIEDTSAFNEIAIWRDSLLSILNLNSRTLVIALHNNTNENYSFSSYTFGGEYAKEADTTYQGAIKDMDDFYFVTDPGIFEVLATGRYHVVLQANETMTDDGSLSVYCAQNGIRYVNIEAQQGRLLRQIKMLIFAFQHLVINRI
ncbi:MAG: hypothetical protein ABIQ02_00465 [Saprospiraceae bacterium]